MVEQRGARNLDCHRHPEGGSMKTQTDLMIAVTQWVCGNLGIDPERDVATIASRVEHEGERFLTLTLPSIGKEFDRALSEGRLQPGGLLSTVPDGRLTFRLFRALLLRVFDTSGQLRDTVDVSAVAGLRQLFYLHEKLRELPVEEKVKEALDGYVLTDEAISAVDTDFTLVREFQKASLALWGTSFNQMVRFLHEDGFLSGAKHGTGAVSEKLLGNRKWGYPVWTERLQTLFPAPEYLAYRLSDEGEGITLLPPGQETPARVIPVPKTAKGPRIICAEPVYNQFVQQGIASLFAHWMRRRHCVNYFDQTRNQELARLGSITGQYATLDLSEASDRVSVRHVRWLFRYHPLLFSAVMACRSQRAALPDGRVVQLRKYASMGSALTFPIETLVFATIVALAVSRVRGVPVESVEDSCRISVYGDDIIVPTDAAEETVRLLEAFGFKVNAAKSFTEGHFRESCGGDYFRGVRVTPVRVRKRLPRSRHDVEETVAIVAFRNLLWKEWGDDGFVTSLTTWIREMIPFPYGRETTPGLTAWALNPIPEGTSKRLQRPTVAALVVKPSKRKEPIMDGERALLKYFWSSAVTEETPAYVSPLDFGIVGRPGMRLELKYQKDLPL